MGRKNLKPFIRYSWNDIGISTTMFQQWEDYCHVNRQGGRASIISLDWRHFIYFIYIYIYWCEEDIILKRYNDNLCMYLVLTLGCMRTSINILIKPCIYSLCNKFKVSSEWASEWASEWLLFNAKWAMFQLYHGENKLRFDDMMMPALY